MARPNYPGDLSALVGALLRTLELRNRTEEHALVAGAQVDVVYDEHDNWDGGIDFYTMRLVIPLEAYIHCEDRLPALQENILKDVQMLLRSAEGYDIRGVHAVPSTSLSETVSVLTGSTGIPSFWTPGHFRLFLSHCSSARVDVGALQVLLAQFGVSGFVAHVDIEPTKDWQGEIERALRSMEALVAVITPDFIASRWCDQEVGIALGRGAIIIPIRYGADPHGFIGKTQALTVGSGRLVTCAADLVRLLLFKPQTAVSMSNALVTALSDSGSFNTTREVMKLLDFIPSVTEEQAIRLRAAVRENSQVAGEWSAPSKLSALLQRHGQGILET